VIRVLPKVVAFEWDKGNIDKNLKKHNVSNQEAEDVFNGESKFIFEDERHSGKEIRYALFGKSDKGRKLSIVFTARKDKIRIITARDMSKKERREYEEIKKNANI
jgi:uncharacterized protein